MTDWEAGCCHPTGGPHGPHEPGTCCHVHAEDLPENVEQHSVPVEPPPGWTAQRQHMENELLTKIAENEQHLHRL